MAFDPDAYLAKNSVKPKTFDPDAYLTKGQVKESSLLEDAGGAALDAVGAVGRTIDRFSGAPTRAGLLALAKKENPLKAAAAQFGEDPDLVSGKQIATELGLEDEEKLIRSAADQEKFDALHNPGWAASMKQAGIKQKDVTVNPAESAGVMIDVVADPLNFVPVSKVTGLAKVPGMLKAAPEALKTFSEGRAIKQAGGMLKDFRRIMGKGRSADVGQALLRESVEVADDAGKIQKVPLMRAGDDVEDIAYKSGLLRKQTGEKIGKLYQDIDNKVLDIDFVRKLPPEDFKKVSTIPRFNPQEDVYDMTQMIADKYGKKIDGQKVVARANEILDQISRRGSSLEESLKIKGELDDMINHAKKTQELPEMQKALMDMRNFIRDKTNNYVEEVSKVLDVKDGQELRKLNKLYGNASEIEGMAADKASRNAANRILSPSDYFTGAIGGMALGPKGLLLGAGNKLAREYGPGLVARGADALSRSRLLPGAGEAVQAGLKLDQPLVRGLMKKSRSKKNE